MSIWIVEHRSSKWHIVRWAATLSEANDSAAEIRRYLRTVTVNTVKRPRVRVFSARPSTDAVLTHGC